MLTLEEAGIRVYGNSLYYLYPSAYLKLFQNKGFFKKKQSGSIQQNF